MLCPSCARISFYRIVNTYIVKTCRLGHEYHSVRYPSIAGNEKFENDLSSEKKDQLSNFGKIGYTGLHS